MTTLTATRPVTAVAAARRPSRPVLGWAAVGVLFVAVQAWAYIGWIASGDAHPTKVGAQHPATIVKVWAWLVQGGTMAMLVVTAVYCVRQCRRERRLTFDTMLVIAFGSVIWQDPILNYLKVQFFYNSYLVNLGSWVEHIPGWVSPRGENLPEPFFLAGFGYLYNIMIVIGICAGMRAVARRRPDIGKLGLITVALAIAFTFDLLLEVFWCRTSLYAYSGAVKSVSLWGGHRYQFPLYESLFWGAFWASVACLRYFRDDNGRAFVERGAEGVAASPGLRTGTRVLAIVGFLNVAYLMFNIAINVAGLQDGPTPSGYPTYLRNEMCGDGTPYACPGPGIPIVTRDVPVDPVPMTQR